MLTPDQIKLREAAQKCRLSSTVGAMTFNDPMYGFRGLATPAAILELLALVEAQADVGTDPAAQFKHNERQNMQGMADCMDMVRSELVEAGIIAPTVAPMFVANAVMAYIAALPSKEADHG